jgi:hypothetical protein
VGKRDILDTEFPDIKPTMSNRESQMGKVKGMLIGAFANMITADNKEKINKWLDDEDRELLLGSFFASSWYPFGTYRHLFDAIASVIAQDDEKTIYQWGYYYSKKLMTGTYRAMFVPNAPLKSIEKNMHLESLFFDFGNVEMKVTGEKSFEIHINGFPRDFKNLYLLKRGWYVRLLEMAGAENIESHFISKSWQGAPSTIIEYRFS